MMSNFHSPANSDGGISPWVLSFSSSPIFGQTKSTRILALPGPPTNATYHSFPSPKSGRSPTLPSFRVPKYGYYNIEWQSSDYSQLLSVQEQISSKASIFMSCVKGISFFMGIGVLCLPFALRMTGWFGIVLLFVFCGIMTYSSLLFGRNHQRFELETFSDHIEFAFPATGRIVIAAVFYTTLLFNAALFIKVLSTTLEALTSLPAQAVVVIVAALAVLVGPTATGNATATLRWVGLVGTCSTVVLIVALVAAECIALQQIHYRGQETGREFADGGTGGSTGLLAEDRVFWTDAVACLKTLGIYGYCYMGHEVFPSIFHDMAQPQHYHYVVGLTFGSMLLCYALIAGLGYAAYGNQAKGSVTENLPAGDALTVLIHVCVLCVTLSKLCLTTAPLSEGVIEWIQLGCYLARRKQHLSGLIGQASRSMPRLRVDNQPSYGTTATSKRAGQLDFAKPGQRQQYFEISTADEKSKEARANQPALSFAPLRRHSLSLVPAPQPQEDACETTPKRTLTWTDTLPIPPIRSPSCEALSLPTMPTAVAGSGSLGRGGGVLLSMLAGMTAPIPEDKKNGGAKENVPLLEPWEVSSESAGSVASSLSTSDSLLDDIGMLEAATRSRVGNINSTKSRQGRPKPLMHDPLELHMESSNDGTMNSSTGRTRQMVDTVLSLCVRTIVPAAAVGLSLLFPSFVTMVVCVGGVCGAAVSIVIPALCYHAINHQRMCGAERCVVYGMVGCGVLLALATLMVVGM